jgi:hypothetical protein
MLNKHGATIARKNVIALFDALHRNGKKTPTANSAAPKMYSNSKLYIERTSTHDAENDTIRNGYKVFLRDGKGTLVFEYYGADDFVRFNPGGWTDYLATLPAQIEKDLVEKEQYGRVNDAELFPKPEWSIRMVSYEPTLREQFEKLGSFGSSPLASIFGVRL